MSGSRLIAVDVSESLIDQAVQVTRDLLSEADRPLSVVFPNRRSIRFYLHRLGVEDTLRVKTYSMDELAADLVFRFTDPVVEHVSDLDRCFSLMESLRTGFEDMYRRLGGEPDRVFPWCLRLVSLMDELDVNLVADVSSLSYVEEVLPEARELLGRLDRLVGLYRNMMTDNNWTGGGDIYRRAYGLRERLKGPLLVVGFSGLTRSESGLFRQVWERGAATVLFQTDLHGRHASFQPYRVYDSWLSGQQWGQKPHREIRSEQPERSQIRIDEAFDLHSELARLHLHLNGCGEKLTVTPTTAAVVIPDSGSLLPALQVIPQRKLNVTAGYPFVRTGFYRLLDSLMTLGSDQLTERGYSTEGLMDMLAHPMVRHLLSGESEGFGESECAVDILMKAGTSYMPIEQFRGLLNSAGQENTTGFVDRLFEPLVRARSLGTMGDVIEALAAEVLAVLPETSGVNTERELIHRFVETLQTELVTSRFKDVKFRSPRVLFDILRHLAARVHVRFEGNPLEGLQMMGFLESRLLQFPYLFIMDVNEGVLPSVDRVDPLLPDSLRPLLKLPAAAEREAIETYHFFRLVDGASEVTLLYRKGETAEQRSIRSRYIEQILVEQAARRAEEDGRVDVTELERQTVEPVVIRLSGLSGRHPAPVLEGKDADRLEEILAGGLSPSFLDGFMRCPYRVFLGRFRRVPEEKDLMRGHDPRHVGELVHKALETGMGDAVSEPLTPGGIERLKKSVMEQFGRLMDRELRSLSSVRAGLLRRLADYRLERFFHVLRGELSKEEIRILSLEQELLVETGQCRLTGRIDRIDLRRNLAGGKARHLVLDYKTGSRAGTPSSKIKPEEWVRLVDGLKGLSVGTGLFQLRKSLNSIQLPLYAFLLSRNHDVPYEDVTGALFLLGAGRYEKFSGAKMEKAGFLAILNYLTDMLKPGLEMVALDDRDCGFCPYVRICRYTTHQSQSWT